MNTRELLRRVGGELLRRDLYYLESQGFITPLRYRVRNVWRRDWPESVIPVLKTYIVLKKEGFKVGVAWERAKKEASNARSAC
jgi:hypothetical protein